MEIVRGAAALVFASAPGVAQASLEVSHTAIFDAQARMISSSAINEYAGQIFLDGTALESKLLFSRSLRLFVNTVLEGVTDIDHQEHTFFDEHGAFIQESFLLWDNGFISLFGGKYNVNFGKAWDITPGIFRKMFSGDYEFTERIGVGGAIHSRLGAFGEHTLSLDAGRVDTSILSASIFTDRGRTSRFDGGLANTAGLDSYNFALDGEKIRALPGFSYHVAFNRQSRPERHASDQLGKVLAARQVYEIEGIQIAATVEWAGFADFGAEMSRATYFTPAMEFSWESFGAAVIYSQRRRKFLSSDHLIEVNAGFAIREGLRITLGWAAFDIEEKRSASLGFRFSYMYDF